MPLSQPGETNASAKLRADQVKTIKQQIEQGVSQREIARTFAIHPATVNDIARGRSWKGIG